MGMSPATVILASFEDVSFEDYVSIAREFKWRSSEEEPNEDCHILETPEDYIVFFEEEYDVGLYVDKGFGIWNVAVSGWGEKILLRNLEQSIKEMEVLCEKVKERSGKGYNISICPIYW